VRYLILSDLHANVDALDAVLDAAAGGAWERAIVLGDLVGYGADPNGVVDRIRDLDPLAVIRGNHDKAACGIDDGSSFNTVARIAAHWTYETLTPSNRDYLRALPMGPVPIDDWLEICHGAPFDEDHYIFDASDAMQAIEAASRPLCLFGHTHLPAVYHYEAGRFTAAYAPDPDEDERIDLREGMRSLVNPGSIGQPRDGDPRAGFALYDTEGPTLFLRRVHYPVGAAQRRILDAGLPTSLANRLAIGR
jgi:diadenosine tetraphosphatase ApaH/serine/threonine PP2A family protein phosphatase